MTVAKASGHGSERAPWVAPGSYKLRGSREQGEEAGNHHVPEDTTEGDSWPRAHMQDSTIPRRCWQSERVHLSRREAGLAGGLRSPRRRASKRYSRRERYPQEGMLLQIDGSRHDWLQGRGPYLTLVGAVDDATGTVPFALFRQQEDAHGYMTRMMLKDISTITASPWSDRHGIFQRSPKEESLEEQCGAGATPPSSVGPWRNWTSGSLAHTPHNRTGLGHLPGPPGLRDAARRRINHRAGNQVLWNYNQESE